MGITHTPRSVTSSILCICISSSNINFLWSLGPHQCSPLVPISMVSWSPSVWSLRPHRCGPLVPIVVVPWSPLVWSLGPHWCGPLVAIAVVPWSPSLWSLGPHWFGHLVPIGVVPWSPSLWSIGYGSYKTTDPSFFYVVCITCYLQLPPLFPHVNFLVSMELDTLNVCSSSMAEAQKMVHMYPSNVCYLGALVYWLRNCSYELKEKYKAVVMLHGNHFENVYMLRCLYVMFCFYLFSYCHLECG